MQGFKQAMSEYEAKLNNPFKDEETDNDYDEPIIDPYEEMLLQRMYENETENQLWYS